MVKKPTEPEDIPRILIKHLPTYQWVKQSCTKYYSGQSYVANSYIKLLVGANKLGLL